MRRSGLQHGRISAIVAAMGHGDLLVIADVGLPIPSGVECIDLVVCGGVPRFLDVLRPIAAELAIESIVLAAELESGNRPLVDEIAGLTGNLPARVVSHEEFKAITACAVAVIRTGETTAYANVILTGGVAF